MKGLKSILRIFTVPTENRRIYGLDILRALAIMFVIFGHAVDFFPKNHFIRNVFDVIIFDGVSIFFVLSGYLIGNIILKKLNYNKRIVPSLFNFLKRRWLRTLPAYYLVLSILVLFANFNIIYITPPHVERYYFFSQNLLYGHPNFFNEAWSLSIEEWFYLIIPLLILLLGKILNINIKKSTLFISLFVVIAALLLRTYRFLNYPNDLKDGWDTYFRKVVALRIDSIMYGVIGALIAQYHFKISKKLKLSLFFVGIGLFIADKIFVLYYKQPYNTLYMCVFSFSIISIASLMLFPVLTSIETGKGIIYKFVTHVALISYSLYLLNYSLLIKLIIPLLRRSFNHIFTSDLQSWITLFLFLFINLITSTLLFKYFERPFLNLRKSDD